MKEPQKGLSIPQQLLLARDMTRRLHILHDAQVLQLKACPYAVDPEIDDNKFQVDIEKKTLVFAWARKNKPKVNSAYTFRLKCLVDIIDMMLGEDWSVTIKVNGKKIYERTPPK